MNLEELTKSQLLLLTVFVNFVTSIAVGVLTVSLLDQAPQTVIQTVNRIVDHTVQTIASTTPIQRIIPSTQPNTVVIHDEDLLTAALAANAAREVYLYATASGTSSPAIATGTFLPKAKAVATASTLYLPKDVLVLFPNGALTHASLSRSGSTVTIYGFADNSVLPKVAVPDLQTKAQLKVGQTVLSTANGGAVTGIITKIDDLVHTNLVGVAFGSAAVSSSGNIIGIAINSLGDFAPSDRITTLLTATSTTLK